jgi:hypothetical protein
MDNLTAVYVDAAHTIPVDFSDPAIQALNTSLMAAQQDQMTAVALALKTVQASAAAVQRAMECSKEFDIEDTGDPRTIGLRAELEAARLQSEAACSIASAKMAAVVGILKEIERISRNHNPKFN